MTRKFDTYAELKRNGFENAGQIFDGCDILHREWKDGHRILSVDIIFTPDHETLKVAYSNGGWSPFKTKNHLNQRRAFNAIRQTVKNNQFEF